MYEWTNNGTNVVRWDYEANPSGWPGNFGMPERDAYLTLGNNVYLFYGEGRIFKYSKGIPKSALSVMNFDNWEEINEFEVANVIDEDFRSDDMRRLRSVYRIWNCI